MKLVKILNDRLKKNIKALLVYLRLYKIAVNIKNMFVPSNNYYITKFNILPFDKYIDSDKNEFPLIKGFRELITPSWEEMYEYKTFKALDLTELEIKEYLKNSNKNIVEMEKIISRFNISFENKVVLDIGCYAGGVLCELLNKNPYKLAGIDIAKYYIIQTKDAKVNNDTIFLAQKKLSELREKVLSYKSKAYTNNINFFEDNIINSKLPDNSFDIILSWQVLEHISEPEKAFAEMNRLLKSGGFMYHDYNPFFSINGGHSLCTLDFPWGHCCLRTEEFIDYMEKFRPPECNVAQNFFNNSLNRMTTRDLFKYLDEYSFRILDVKFSTIPELEKFYSNIIFTKISELYPSVMLNDLLQTSIIFVAQKI